MEAEDTQGDLRDRDSDELDHLVALEERYPDLAHDIERLIRLAGERRRLALAPQRVRTVWKGDMGITIVQKSDLTVRKRNPRIVQERCIPKPSRLFRRRLLHRPMPDSASSRCEATC